eukprot:s1_g924.t1
MWFSRSRQLSSSGDLLLLERADVQQDEPILHVDRVGFYAPAIGALPFTARKVDDQVVEGTGHALVVHNALRQGAAEMRAAVVNGEDLIGACAKNCDCTSRYLDEA